jgi:hypothetical protein
MILSFLKTFAFFQTHGFLNETYSDLITPAVRGTTSILNSALKHGSTVKRLILTSSVVAVIETGTVPRVFTESNWNDSAVEAVGQLRSTWQRRRWQRRPRGSSSMLTSLRSPGISLPSLLRISLGQDYVFFRFQILPLLTSCAHIHSPRSAPRRRLMTSTPLSVKSMTPSLVHGQVRNCMVKETRCMLPSPQRPTCALHMRLLQEASGLSSDPVPSFSRTSVSCLMLRPILPSET